MSPEEVVAELLRRGEWKAVEDKTSGRTYFYNPVSKERVWSLEKHVVSKGISHQHSHVPHERPDGRTATESLSSTTMDSASVSCTTATASAHYHKRLPADTQRSATGATDVTTGHRATPPTAAPPAAPHATSTRRGASTSHAQVAEPVRQLSVRPRSRGQLLALTSVPRRQPAGPKNHAKATEQQRKEDAVVSPASSLLGREMYGSLLQAVFFRKASSEPSDALASLMSTTVVVGTFVVSNGPAAAPSSSTSRCGAFSLEYDGTNNTLMVTPVLLLDVDRNDEPPAQSIMSTPPLSFGVAHPLVALRPARHEHKDHEFLLLELTENSQQEEKKATTTHRAADRIKSAPSGIRTSLAAFDVAVSSVVCRGAFSVLSPSPRGIPWAIVSVDEPVPLGMQVIRCSSPTTPCLPVRSVAGGAPIVLADDIMSQEPLWSMCTTPLGSLPRVVAQLHRALIDESPRCGARRTHDDEARRSPQATAQREAEATAHLGSDLGTVERVFESVLSSSICDPILQAERIRRSQWQHEPIGQNIWGDVHSNLFRRWERHCDPEVLQRLRRRSTRVGRHVNTTAPAVEVVQMFEHRATPLDVCLAGLELLESSLRCS